MADWDEPGPGEHLIRLLKAILGLIVVYLLCSCVAWSFRWHEWVAEATGLSRRTAVVLVVLVPGLLVVPLAAAGFVLARSAPSRGLFVAAGLFGVLFPLALLLAAEVFSSW
jgi:hypothetical protein